jgi:hypothetical protein
LNNFSFLKYLFEIVNIKKRFKGGGFFVLYIKYTVVYWIAQFTIIKNNKF